MDGSLFVTVRSSRTNSDNIQYEYSKYLDWRRSTQSELLASAALWTCAVDHFKEGRETLLASLKFTRPSSSR